MRNKIAAAESRQNKRLDGMESERDKLRTTYNSYELGDLIDRSFSDREEKDNFMRKLINRLPEEMRPACEN